MGPEATCDLMQRVIRATPAAEDKDHIRMVVDSNPKVPSRIKAILDGSGENPANCLVDMARKLEDWGVDFLAIPCNTAHYYYPEIQAAVRIPVLNMIALAAEAVLLAQPDIRRVGILASTATLLTKLYDKHFNCANVTLVCPGGDAQALLMTIIQRIKSGRIDMKMQNKLLKLTQLLADKKAQAAIIACTELSLIAGGMNATLPVYDASDILAHKIVHLARNDAI